MKATAPMTRAEIPHTICKEKGEFRLLRVSVKRGKQVNEVNIKNIISS